MLQRINQNFQIMEIEMEIELKMVGIFMIFCAQKKKRATRLSNNTVRSQNPLLFVILTLNKKNVKDLYINLN